MHANTYQLLQFGYRTISLSWFLELSPFDKMQSLIGDVSFNLDTNIGLFLFFYKIAKPCYNNYFYKEVLFRKQDNIGICDNPIPVSQFYAFVCVLQVIMYCLFMH